jgi:hypothetical protein
MFIANLFVISFDFTSISQTYRHLGLENNTEDIRPMLYLTYTGIGSDGEVIFRDDKNFDETLPSLEFDEGLLPDRPDRGERARRRAILTM